jgi:hypothetical protein
MSVEYFSRRLINVKEKTNMPVKYLVIITIENIGLG